MDQSYIAEFEKNEEAYKDFYNKSVTSIKLFYIYVNENNDVYNIKSGIEEIENGVLTNERILYLILNNQYNLTVKHRLVSLLKYNFNLDHIELKNFLHADFTINETNNFLSSLKIIDNIYFKDTISIFHDLNSVFFIFTNNMKTKHNTTKRIILTNNSNNTKTRRNNTHKLIQKTA